ncbi:hypothetical protein AVEN_176272-1 [Araneus ventricosus]|uniref:Uncharacterized protein n=1 Tax=Araneus ventricosus TaxID=182803 RepID=A0A4Y2SX36_ARAVE|nr:hypothetical protein AVEN_238484-1 [Araneus ventricosus]GBN91440.1 hypothetical protein AVEN_176272-1 [Araneus ventricosus]
MVEKRDLQRFLIVIMSDEAWAPDIGETLGDKMEVLEYTCILDLFLLGTELWRTFERILYDVTSYDIMSKKGINNEILRCLNRSLWSLVRIASWSAVRC